MKDMLKKVAVGLSTTALLTQMMVLPSFAGITVVVSGNGVDTDNTVNVTSTNTTTVNQTNEANINNDVDATANSGGNEVDGSTGGDVSIDTGKAEATVGVSNAVNSNEAHVACGGCPTNVSVEISENGKKSDNDVTLGLQNTTWVKQDNTANIKNDVDVDANSGENDIKDSTGGDYSIDTGMAKAYATVSNQANANVATVAGGGEGALALVISGNGVESDNTITLGLKNDVTLFQNNLANISNDIEVDAVSGKNDIEDSTGGLVSIDTGDAEAGATVDTMANFNYADVLDCCDFGGLVKVAGNGKESDNDVNLAMLSSLYVTQDNDFLCGRGGYEHPMFELFGKKFSFGGYDKGNDCNDVDVLANSGDNNVDDSTGEYDGDPSIDTGNAKTVVDVENAGNSNVFTTGDALSDLPEMDFGSMNWFIWLLAGGSNTQG